MELEEGNSFKVEVYDDYVIKYPKMNEQRLKEIALLQTELSELVDGVLPCEYKEGCLVMPKAPGIRGDRVDVDKKTYIQNEIEKIYKKIQDNGYQLGDISLTNVFYDEDNDKVYLIDFDSVKKVVDNS